MEALVACTFVHACVHCEFLVGLRTLEVRAAGANAYATTKDRRANKIIEDKELSIGFKAITFGTYGAFGKSTHKLIATATANTPQPLLNPWVKPGPKAHAYLLFGFSLARANARMIINAEAKRRNDIGHKALCPMSPASSLRWRTRGVDYTVLFFLQ